MQFSSMLAVFVVAFLTLLTPHVVRADACNMTELAEALLPLTTNAKYPTCVADVGVSLPFTSMPTDEQLAAMCASSACEALLAIAVTLDLPDCEVTVNGTAYNVLLVRARRAQQCSSASLSSSITASVSSSEAASG
ncbi:hypothetical protein BBJ28_00013376 [Nothophytophthora sp. Chile5]|nr:hypothetical protein BBJ28_00013376 [Nothophytophthora sp. Chile5]